MRWSFIVFFGVFFTAYGLVNLYIFVRGWQAISQGSYLRTFYVPIFLILSLSFIGGRLLENLRLSWVSDFFVWVGSFWLAAMLYFFLALVLLDLARLINHWLAFLPSPVSAHYATVKQWTAFGLICMVGLVLLAGHINALSPRIRTLDLSVPKKNAKMDTVDIVVASDIHLGTLVGQKWFDKIVDRINVLNPDIILLPGDIVDEDLGPVIKQNLGESLRSLKSRFGVFAITGNHEYIGGVEEASRYLVDHGVTVLRDRVLRINETVYLVGREDRSMDRFTEKTREPLKDLMAEVDGHFPVILMDHQPFHLEEGEDNGVDLQVSGHTHHGQLFPLNFITGRIYELSRGYKKKGKAHIYVSSGVGTWGPPVRLGNRPEIVNIKLRLVDDKG
jgi:predicted MPP superfamily phosphohydrolase